MINWSDNYLGNFSRTDLISETLNRTRPDTIWRSGSALLAIASGTIQIRTFRRVRDLLLLQRANVFWSTLGCLWYALPLKRKQSVILNVGIMKFGLGNHWFSEEINIISNWKSSNPFRNVKQVHRGKIKIINHLVTSCAPLASRFSGPNFRSVRHREIG